VSACTLWVVSDSGLASSSRIVEAVAYLLLRFRQTDLHCHAAPLFLLPTCPVKCGTALLGCHSPQRCW
jgi:uncharacterized metal-binding protein